MTGVKQEEDVVRLSTSPRAVSKTLLGPQKGLGTQRAVGELGQQRGLRVLTQLNEGRDSLVSWGLWAAVATLDCVETSRERCQEEACLTDPAVARQRPGT